MPAPGVSNETYKRERGAPGGPGGVWETEAPTERPACSWDCGPGSWGECWDLQCKSAAPGSPGGVWEAKA